MLGKEVFNEEIVVSSPQFVQEIDLGGYIEGFYIVNIITNTGESYTERVSYIR